ncbi:MAG: GNAT family N-acetyltransferase [Alphaproteobacteria bacterium]|nr:GNAT family N-acetyltransferase [Alphaproteobacteria bacterium]
MFALRRSRSPVPGFDGRIEAERVALRRLASSDTSAIVHYVNDWDVAKQTASLPWPYPTATARDWLLLDAERWERDKEYVLAIEARDSGELIGALAAYMTLRTLSGTGRAEIGYWLGKPFWGRGLASEAVGAFLGFCARDLLLTRLHAYVFADNVASGRVLEKCGFTIGRILARSYPSRGGRRLVHRYARSLP